MLRKLVKAVLRAFGFEVHRTEAYTPALPAWITEPEPNRDEIIESPWETAALHLANRHHKPPRLVHRRTRFGDDQRIKYMAFFLDVRDLRVLELGPYEGHHSIVLEKMGVRELVAIEGRAENHAKCLRVKQKYGLCNTQFYLQDIEALYNGKTGPPYFGSFDLVFCCGLLYHLPEPARALEWMRKQGKALFLATHYVESAALARYTPPMFTDAEYEYCGRSYRGKRFKEGGLGHPISGLSAFSFWPYESDLLRMLKDTGYTSVHVLGKDLQNNTPHITILAEVELPCA